MKTAATLRKRTPKETSDTLKENGVWNFRKNQELIHWYREADTISEIRERRLRRLGHLERMPEVIRAKEVFKNIKKVKVRWKAKKKMVE